LRRRMLVLFLFSAIMVVQFELNSYAEDRVNLNTKRGREAVNLLETWIESVIDYDRIPGMSIAIIHDQEIVYANGFGYIDDERKVKAKAVTIYSICSISKLFTAIAVMQLRDAGKLNLDDPVARYLPWFAPEMVGPEDQPPTLRDLLRHSSGLPCEPENTVWSEPDQLYPTHEELIDRVASLKMSYPAKTKYNYSNLGYALLGEVISAVSGMKYSDYVKHNILYPLGMENTTPYLPNKLLGSKMAIGYGCWPRRGPRVEIANSDSKSMVPARGYASTVEDMARFAMWQFRTLDGSDEIVLSRETLLEMQDTAWVVPSWGLGFAIWHMGDDVIVGHQGGCPGYKSQIIICPERKIAVVAMVNVTDAPQFSLVFNAYEIMAPALLDAGDMKEIASEWSRYTGYYTSDKSWSDAEVVQWHDSLAVMWVPSGDPVGSLIMLSRVEDNVYRQVGNNGELGKHYIFRSDEEGNIVGMKFNSNLMNKTPR